MNTKISQIESAQAPAARLSARERLLAAAAELFYEEGVQSVGIEKVIERAGVAKASLYGNFKGKDDLVRSYLAARSDARRNRIEQRLAKASKPRDKLLAMFDALGDAMAQPNYRGCPFVRASAEMRPDSSAREVCAEARTWTRALFIDLARQAGAARPEQLANQLVLLYDGASVSAQMDGDLRAAATARAVAAQMLDAACQGRPRR
jgi:AcrR family transcriptional regulator